MPDDSHRPAIPLRIEDLLAALEELRTVHGAAGQQVFERVRHRLGEAMAARDRGDPPAALASVGEAMDDLARLAETLDPGEASMMRMLSDHFRRALLRGDATEARRDLSVMLDRSGSRVKKED